MKTNQQQLQSRQNTFYQTAQAEHQPDTKRKIPEWQTDSLCVAIKINWKVINHSMHTTEYQNEAISV